MEDMANTAPKGDMLQNMEGGVDAATQKRIDSYTTLLMDMIHNKATSGKVLDMLKADKPERSVPSTALTINDTAMNMMQETGESVTPDILLPSSVYLVGDLIDTGNSSGIFNVTEQQIPGIFQSTVQGYIEKGLKDGSIDPIELQASIEPMLNEQQMAQGQSTMQQSGIPSQPTQQMAMDSYAKKKNMQQGVI